MTQAGKTIAIVVITAIIVGGGVYFWQQNTQKESPATPSANTAPRIVYSAPGTFTENEKNMLQEKLIEPYIFFYEKSGDPVLTISISKTKSALPTYSIQAIHKTADSGFSFMPTKGKTTKLEDYPAWYPDCFDTNCQDLPKEFQEKYPELFQQALRTGGGVQ